MLFVASKTMIQKKRKFWKIKIVSDSRFSYEMPRNLVPLDEYQEKFQNLYHCGHCSSQIVNYLKKTHDIVITSRTIEWCLKAWNLTNKRVKTEDTSELRLRISLSIIMGSKNQTF